MQGYSTIDTPPVAPAPVPPSMGRVSSMDGIRTLASLDEDKKAESVCSRDPPGADARRQGIALLVASAPSHELDRTQQPNPLLELGGVTMVSHALWQLNNALYAKVVIVIGFRGEEVKAQASQCMTGEKEVFAGFGVEFIDLGKGFRGGRVASIIQAKSKMEAVAGMNNSFTIVGTDHIFDVALLQEAAVKDLKKDGDDACVLVETDLEGMVGLPPSTVYCATRPLHSQDRVYSIGTDIDTYSGIEAGLIVLGLPAIARLAEMHESEDRKGAHMNRLLATYAQNGTLCMIKTNGRTWFSVETSESMEYTSAGLDKSGREYTLTDGRQVRFVGLPAKVQISPVDGGEWSEFNVAKWRSGMFTAKSFFQQLFVDTTEFISGFLEEKGGIEKAMVVEVGCGTGEALLPLSEHARYSVGMDFNNAFIEFCKENTPADRSDRVMHLWGDAQELISLLMDELPDEWMEDSRPKIVISVGNTVGIMPEEVRRNVYQQMKTLAGPNGYIIVVYWNGNKFGDAVQNFYHKNDQLCGKFRGEHIDMDSCTLRTPSGYTTHWTKPEEARGIFENEIGVEVVSLVEKGNGVLVCGRMRPGSDRP